MWERGVLERREIWVHIPIHVLTVNTYDVLLILGSVFLQHGVQGYRH